MGWKVLFVCLCVFVWLSVFLLANMNVYEGYV